MKRIQTITHWAAAVSQLSHLFCCGLPALFSILSLLSTFGIALSLPSSYADLHHLMHDYELPVLAFAGSITLIGWALHYVSWRMDCTTTGCLHEPCRPKKKRSNRILIFSTVLFLFNVIIYMTAHG